MAQTRSPGSTIPQNLSVLGYEDMLESVESHVQRGGRVLLAISPFKSQDNYHVQNGYTLDS